MGFRCSVFSRVNLEGLSWTLEENRLRSERAGRLIVVWFGVIEGLPEDTHKDKFQNTILTMLNHNNPVTRKDAHKNVNT